MFEFIKKRKASKIRKEYFKLMSGYTPVFTNYEGGIYEMELTRSCIHSFATHISKLKPVINGNTDKEMERLLQFSPNILQDTAKWLYQMATIYQVENNVFIVPDYDRDGKTIIGFRNVAPSKGMVIRGDGDELYLKYEEYGIKKAIELRKVGVLSKFLYKDGLFGVGNEALRPTLNIIDTNNQGIIEGIKNSASIRFFGKLGMTLNDEDLRKTRKRIMDEQLSMDNNGGMLLLDNKFSEFKQIDSKPYIVNGPQMELIKNNVFSYLNTNEKIIQNSYNSNEWNAYYEGAIEPFALQLGLVLTNLIFNNLEKEMDSEIIFTANRLQYLSNEEKLETVTQMFDRGFMTHNQGLEIFNMPGIGPEGDKRYIRKEYAESTYIDSYNGGKEIDEPEEQEGEEDES